MADIQSTTNLTFNVINQSLQTINIIASTAMAVLEGLDRTAEKKFWETELGNNASAFLINVGGENADFMNEKIASAVEAQLISNRNSNENYIPFKTINTNQGTIFLIKKEDEARFKDVVNVVYDKFGIDKTYGGYELNSAMDPYRRFMGENVSGKTATYSVNLDIADKFEQSLNDMEIAYTKSGEVDGKAIYNVDAKGRETKLEFAMDSVLAASLPGGSVDYSILSAESRNGNINQRPVISSIHGLSIDKAKMFEKMAQKANIHINITTDGEQYTVRYCPKDQDVINDMRLSVAINSHTKQGQLLSLNLSTEQELKEKAIMDASYQFEKGQNFVVMDLNSQNYITVNNDGIQSGNKLYNRDDLNYSKMENQNRMLKTMATEVAQYDKVVIMSKEEFEQYKVADNQKEFLNLKAKEQGYATINQKDAAVIQAEQEKINLLIDKQIRSRPQQEFIKYDLEDDKMLLEEFKTKEDINEEYVEDIEFNEEEIREEVDKLEVETTQFVRDELQKELLDEERSVDDYAMWMQENAAWDANKEGNPYMNDEIEFGDVDRD